MVFAEVESAIFRKRKKLKKKQNVFWGKSACGDIFSDATFNFHSRFYVLLKQFWRNQFDFVLDPAMLNTFVFLIMWRDLSKQRFFGNSFFHTKF